MNSSNRLKTLRAIAASGADGATRAHLQTTTRIDAKVMVNIINNSMKQGQLRSVRIGATCVYRLTSNGKAILTEHDRKTAQAGAAAKPQRKQHDIAKITHSDPEGRSGNLSPERRSIERVMREARQPLTSAVIADRAAVDRKKVKRMLQRIQRDGWATMTKGEGNELLWSLRDRSANIVAAGSLVQPHVNSTQPNGDQAYWARYTSDLMTPARRELQA